jgi:type III secretion system FlhB-like substrate exporter
MIARGSSDEDLARRHIVRLQGLIAHWNEDADTYRRVARGQATAAPWMLEEADRTHLAIREDAELCDTLVDNLPPGHELWGELLRLGTALYSLSESIAVSAEAMGPRIEQSRDIAGLRYLVGELRRNADQTVPG